MYRDIENDLIRWKDKSHRKPLIIRGARQIGKSYAVEKFGTQHFKHFVKVDFEKDPQISDIFNHSLDPIIIIDFIAKSLQQAITPGKTLLFLDEIQLCPRAIQALRYFKEDMPALHVIAAGSLLEFALKRASFSMPVGRIESMYMKPLSFYEFITAQKKKELVVDLNEATLKNPINPALHAMLINELKLYFEIGGMPEVISHYLQSQSTYECQEIQASIIDVYKNDFGKYNEDIKTAHINNIFEQSPYLIGEKFKYNKINPDIKSRDLKPALHGLIDAGLLYPIHHTAASGLPFGATRNNRKFKLNFLDVGLVQYVVNAGTIATAFGEWPALNQGPLSEQFVGQELIAYYELFRKPELFYWEREKAGSTAEIDFVINAGNNIFPIEVKSGKTGRLKSLQGFIQEKSCLFGIKISENPLSFEKNILSVPFYMIKELPRLIGDQVAKTTT